MKLIEDHTDCHKVNLLSEAAEVFYGRLKMKADDFGRYHADVNILRSTLYPLKTNIRNTLIARCLDECRKAGLLHCYVDGERRPVLEIYDGKQRKKSMTARFGPKEGQQALPLVSDPVHPPPKKILLPVKGREEKRKEERGEPPARGGAVPVEEDLSGAIAAGAVEVPDEATALSQADTRGIPQAFARLCFADWSENNGCDAKNVPKPWLAYLSKRWRYEEQDWRSGKHRGLKVGAGGGTSTGGGDGPTVSEVREYAKSKGDEHGAYGVSWWQVWNKRKWRNNAGRVIDWKVEFSAAWAKDRGRRESEE